jgi:hypothetical protein
MSGIRLGGVTDIPAIWELALELQKEGPSYKDIPPSKEKFVRLVANMMHLNSCRVTVVVDKDDKVQGFLLGMIEEFFWSTRRYATDMAVYVRAGFKHHVPRLFREFIKWAESKPRVVRIILGLSSGIGSEKRTGKMYTKLGLSNVGGIYLKEVIPCPA